MSKHVLWTAEDTLDRMDAAHDRMRADFTPAVTGLDELLAASKSALDRFAARIGA